MSELWTADNLHVIFVILWFFTSPTHSPQTQAHPGKSLVSKPPLVPLQQKGHGAEADFATRI